jgi:hypothetical protein
MSSINRVGAQPDVYRQSIVLTCDDRPTLIVEIHVWASMPDGTKSPNSVFCEIYTLVRDTGDGCS